MLGLSVAFNHDNKARNTVKVQCPLFVFPWSRRNTQKDALSPGFHFFEIEHIIPHAADGETIFENLCFACPTCNRYKSDRVSFQSKPIDLELGTFHPQQNDRSAHFRWNDDATELLGVTPIGQATIDLLRINRPQMICVGRMWVAMGEHPPLNL